MTMPAGILRRQALVYSGPRMVREREHEIVTVYYRQITNPENASAMKKLMKQRGMRAHAVAIHNN